MSNMYVHFTPVCIRYIKKRIKLKAMICWLVVVQI